MYLLGVQLWLENGNPAGIGKYPAEQGNPNNSYMSNSNKNHNIIRKLHNGQC